MKLYITPYGTLDKANAIYNSILLDGDNFS